MTVINENHWVFKKHTNNMAILVETALYLKTNKSNISVKTKKEMYGVFESSEIYNPRKSLRDKPLDAINHKLDGLKYYMFGYSDNINGQEKFIFSPLGNLFLKYLGDEEAVSKIFCTMLVGIQFPHPASLPSEKFSVFPFRLIFSLLIDPRLNGRVYHFEIVKYIIYIDKINPQIYEELVKNILASRELTDQLKFDFLKKNEEILTKSIYEWNYYVSKILNEIKIININYGTMSIDVFHPQKSSSKSPPTKRKANNGYFTLTSSILPFVEKLLGKYSIYDSVVPMINSKEKSNDIVKEIYSFYPDELLEEINEVPNSVEKEMLKLPKLIEEYSLNPDGVGFNRFEDILLEAFNMFINVDAIKLSGAGKTDIECIFLQQNQKFAVEAKSTANKLTGINAGRLKRHRDLIGAAFTIVVTPRYVPSVKYDIQGQEIVIIKANTFSEYMYNNIISKNRDIDFEEIHKIVVENIGNDISDQVSELTLTKFG